MHMNGLPSRPDLAQLRRQAKELHRGAAAGDAESLRRLDAVSKGTTLAAAQLAVAREHGFGSWPSMAAAVEAARADVGRPLMTDKHRNAAVFGARDFLDWAHTQGWDAGVVPVGAVFTSQTFITTLLAGDPVRYRPSTELTPTNGQVFLTLSAKPVAIACLGVGAPAMVTVLEHLVGLGVRAFIGVGPAPAVATDVRWGDCVVVDRALRDDGVSVHYLPPARYAEADVPLTERLVAEAAVRGLEPRIGSGWTVPTPYRTTEEELTAYRREGTLITDMVTAALFAVATALGARAASAGIASRTLGVSAGPAPRPGRISALIDAAVATLEAAA